MSVDAVEIIRDACREGVDDFAEIDCRVVAAFPGISLAEMANTYREAARRILAEADELGRFAAERFG